MRISSAYYSVRPDACHTIPQETHMLKRLTVFTAAGILIGLPLTLSARAQTPEVTFNGGGIGVLLCGSKPDRFHLTVASGATVRLTNGMDGVAELKIDGVARA